MASRLWPYTPSLGLNSYFLARYAILFCIELIQVVIAKKRYGKYVEKTKSKRFTNQQIPLLVGLVLEAAGYGFRIGARNADDSIFINAIQSLFLLIAPIFIAATMYMSLGQIIQVLRAEQVSLIKVKYLTKIFVTGDIISFILQASGGGMMVMEGMRDFGKWLAVGGLIVQLFFFFGFIVAVVHLWISLFNIHRRSRFASGGPALDSKTGFLLSNNLSGWGNWKHALGCLLFASLLIFVRSIFRTVEFSEGFNGPLQSSEHMLFGLDTTMVTCACISLITVNYSKFYHSVTHYHNNAFTDVPYELSNM